MKHGEDHERVIALSEVDGLWEPTQYCAADVPEDEWMSLGVVGCTIDCFRSLIQELFAEPALVVVVPRGGFFKFVLGGALEDNSQTHLPSLERTDAFTSLHGMTSSG